ncbi:hypothetical protein MT325_m162L [Paramecium bursaria chlorella virus MT325]|uniref:Uncharacterized protein m162L n=1 Tax=Paramecium bursaria Chlorella virus MT325 TaxID=346932 RepID=A7ITP2_PBCVM|nr:hypothetical protein MT325_m162L [Paramecium bursaria chlorella virus MT325]
MQCYAIWMPRNTLVLISCFLQPPNLYLSDPFYSSHRCFFAFRKYMQLLRGIPPFFQDSQCTICAIV